MDIKEYNQEQARRFYKLLKTERNPVMMGWNSKENTLPMLGGWPTGASGYQYTADNGYQLMMASAMNAFTSPLWVTFDQLKAAGGGVKKGEMGTKILSFTKSEGTYKPYLMTVFNADQTYGLDKQVTEPRAAKLAQKEIDAVIKGFGVKIVHDNKVDSSFDAGTNTLTLPQKANFTNNHHNGALGYYQAIVGSVVASRVAENFGGVPNEPQGKARLQLRQEMARSMASARLGLPHEPTNDRSYIQEWVAQRPSSRELDEAFKDAEKALKDLGVERFKFEPLPKKDVEPEVAPASKENSKPMSKEAQRYQDKGQEMSM